MTERGKTVAYAWAYGAMAVAGGTGVVYFAGSTDALGVCLAAAVLLGGAIVCQHQLWVLSLERTMDRRLQRAMKEDTPEYVVARWQKVRDRIERQARRGLRWNHDVRGGEGYRLLREKVADRYNAAAGDARARGEWVPTLEQLRVDAAGDNEWP